MSRPVLPALLDARLPLFYGWVVLFCLGCAGFARQGPAVATLSIFVEPLTREFGWSRTALSGAVSLGGVLAALVAPLIGPVLDRRGSRLVLCAAVLANGALLMGLSLTGSLLTFYLLFCLARMNWAAPFELGLYGALNNWFVRRRAFASSVATLAQQGGLVAMPLIAQLAILREGWRAGWLAIGAATLLIGFVPVWLFLVRRPEDLGLLPDGVTARPDSAIPEGAPAVAAPEPAFTRREALASPAFWLLLTYTVLVYPVQAGVSLHQAPYLIERSIDPTIAATIVSTFSLASAAAVAACGALPRWLPIRYPLAVTGALLTLGVVLMLGIASAAQGFVAGGIFGLGLGALLTLLPIGWADYFGRAHFGAIRGIALSAQVLAQAAGPLFSGVLRDLTGDYRAALQCFAVLAGLSIVAALAARQPRLLRRPT
jgi:OFA family oxalate/formate antiporter-like MFS transporter